MVLYRYLDKNLFAPPQRLLPLAVFAFVALSFLYHPQSPFQTFELRDPDDYMRLNEVINWFRGQGWYNLSHPRLSPGAATVLHWSRLVDLPIAVLMLPFVKLWGLQSAAMVAALLVPLILLGFLLILLPALAKPLVGTDHANLASVFLLFAPMTLFNFTPGHIDHHNWQILIAGFGLLALGHITGDAKGWRFSIAAALTFACGLWIGTEALPWLILFTGCLALSAAWEGGFILRNGAVFGAALVVATAAVLLIAVLPAEFPSRALSWFSMADVIFAALAGSVLILGWSLGRLTLNRYLRLAFIGALAIFASLLFVSFVPDMLLGPFADFDDFDSGIALSNIGEAIPLASALAIKTGNMFSLMATLMVFVRFLFLPVLAVGTVLYNVRTAPPGQRMLWLFHGVFLISSLLLALFWQARIGWFLQLFTIAPLVWLVFAWWERIAATFIGRKRFWAEAGAFLVLGPLPVLLLPAIVANETLYPNLILFPAAAPPGNSCPLKKAAEFIAGPWGYIDRPYTILAGANEGPELLFRTADNVIAANFNVAGNKDVFDFFNARDDQTALAILKKWHVDLVLTCRDVPPFYSGTDHPRLGQNVFLKQGADGKLHLTADPNHPTLIEKLINGAAPAWLKPVEIPGTKDYLLFDVKPSETTPPANGTAKKNDA